MKNGCCRPCHYQRHGPRLASLFFRKPRVSLHGNWRRQPDPVAGSRRLPRRRRRCRRLRSRRHRARTRCNLISLRLSNLHKANIDAVGKTRVRLKFAAPNSCNWRDWRHRQPLSTAWGLPMETAANFLVEFGRQPQCRRAWPFQRHRRDSAAGSSSGIPISTAT